MAPPLKYTDPEKMQDIIDAYVEKCEAGELVDQLTKKGEVIQIQRKLPVSMAGLAEALDINREVLNRYSSGQQPGQEYEISQAIRGVISRARRRIETNNINMGLMGAYESRINQLNLSSNFGYSQKQELEHTGKLALEDALRDLED